MLNACVRIIAHRGGDERSAVLENQTTRDAVLWNLLVLGEAAKKIPDDIANKVPQVHVALDRILQDRE